MGLRSWDQQPAESVKAYRAFEVYLDLGHDRSLDAAFRRFKGVSGVQRAPGTWQRWFAKYRWRERADDHDRFMAMQCRVAREHEQCQMMEEHVKRAIHLSRSMFSASVRALILATQRLENVNVLELDVKDVASVLRAAAYLGQSAMVVEQDALGVQALMEKIKEVVA